MDRNSIDASKRKLTNSSFIRSLEILPFRKAQSASSRRKKKKKLETGLGASNSRDRSASINPVESVDSPAKLPWHNNTREVYKLGAKNSIDLSL